MGKPFTEEERQKYEKIKKLVLGVIKRMDNKKMLNYKRYEDFFNMCDVDPDLFRNWDVLHSDELDSAPYLLQLPFEEVRMNQIKDAAEFLGIELEDYIYYRHHDKRGIRSKMKVPVGFVPIKRVDVRAPLYRNIYRITPLIAGTERNQQPRPEKVRFNDYRKHNIKEIFI